MVKQAPDINVSSLIRDEREALYTFQTETEVGLDLETSGLSPFRDCVAVVILRGKQSERTAVLHNRGHWSSDLKRFFEHPDRTFVGHNITGFDLPFMVNAGVDIWRAKGYWDTLVSESVVQSSARRSVSASLKASLSRRVGVTIKKDADHSGWLNEELNDKQLEYAGGDLQFIFDLQQAHIDRAAEEGSAEHMRLEMDIIPAVVAMTTNGIPLDQVALREFLGKRATEADEIQERINALAGWAVNLNSHVQVKRLFVERFNVQLTGTAVDVMENLARSSTGILQQTATDVAEWRHAKQNLKMYGNPTWVPKFVHEGCVHCRFWQCGTDTGRFSSTDPNLQQVPKKMRHVFGNAEGLGITSADYAQIEVRIAAAKARDLALLQDCEAGDVHTSIAMGVFGVDEAAVHANKGDPKKDYRRLAKAQSFRLLFGGGAGGLYDEVRSQGSDITMEDAQQLVHLWRRRYPGLDAMRRKAFGVASRRGAVVVTLPYGMRRVLAAPNLTGMRLLNTAIQGTAGVGMKCALRQAVKRGLHRQLSLTVHDELVAVNRLQDQCEYGHELEQAMLDGMREVTEASLRVEVSRGTTWGKNDLACRHAAESAA